ncbi:MAG TPA: alpha-amylase family glycosyl hydrolase [Candidatus Limnocylindrales bacterium]|nr:alpha-amylase family glycosyl hydrolase [Candidatus Limnocylindrales bacterium]
MVRRLLTTLIIAGLVAPLSTTEVLPAPKAHASATCDSTAVTNKVNYETDTIYQILTDRFADGDPTNNNPYSLNNSYDSNRTDVNRFFGGDWLGIVDKIDYLKNMGVTAIWISPPYDNLDEPYLENSTYYNAYHGFWAKDYFRPDEHWGDWNDFDQLISTAHANGIKVVIDYAPNHTNHTDSVEKGALYRDGQLVGRYDNDTLGLFHHLGERQGNQTTKFDFQFRDLTVLADLSHENSLVVDYLTDSIDVWLSRGVDGIRNDATLHQSDAFRTQFADHINATNPVFHFGEYFIGSPDPKYDDYRTSPERTGIDLLDFEFANTARSTFGDFSKSMTDLKNMIEYTATDYRYENNAVTFLDSHDKSRLASIQPNQGISHAALAFLLTSRGTPVIYYGTEQYMTGNNGDAGRKWMTDFDEQTTAFQLVKKLSDLRKSNPGLAYGPTTFRWNNNDVLIYERQFFDDTVLVAVNRSGTTSQISGLFTNLPGGSYNDYLGGLLDGNSISVGSNGAVSTFDLGPTEVGVWQFRSSGITTPQIGAVGPTIGRAGNEVAIDGQGFGTTAGTVYFGSTAATVLCWADDQIRVTVPNVSPGLRDITVVRGSNTSNAFTYQVLTGPQVQVLFHVDATTNWGQNVYVTGDVYELGQWDPQQPWDPFFNPNYPYWFLPVAVPANTAVDFKFIKRDGSNNVTWEGGSNRTFTTPSSGATDTPGYTWQP